MTMFKKTAVRAVQGRRPLFLTALTLRDFMVKDFYRVNKLDVQESRGIQRLLNEARAKSFGRDILTADEYNEAFLPTSVFLATGGSVGYDEETRELFFDSAPHAGVCPLDVVDGQHRIEGLKMMAGQNEHLLDFPIFTVIAPDLTEAEKMLQFVTVNTKQRAVDQGVAQHIIARFTKMLDVETLPYIPSWLKERAEKGDDAKALDIVQALNTNGKSLWRGRIQFADEKKQSHHTIKQASFVRSVKSHLLAKRHPFNQFTDEKRFSILMNFWIAVERVFVGRSDIPDTEAQPAVFKESALEFFHSISAPVIQQLARKNSYTVDAIEECIRSAQDHLPPAEAGILSPEYWQSGGLAGQQNRGGMSKLAAVFSEALKHANDDDIEI